MARDTDIVITLVAHEHDAELAYLARLMALTAQREEPYLFISLYDEQYKLPVYIDSELPKHDQMSLAMPVVVELEDSRMVSLPAGFITDCHSTPGVLLPSYDTKTNLAAIVHDFLYMHYEQYQTAYPELLAELNLLGVSQRAYCDSVYKELMHRFSRNSSRLERSRNWLYWLAVRAFGWWNWRKFRKGAKQKIIRDESTKISIDA